MVRRMMGDLGWHTDFGQKFLRDEKGWDTTMAILETFREEVENDGATFVVLLIPPAFDVQTQWRAEVQSRFKTVVRDEQWAIDSFTDEALRQLHEHQFMVVSPRSVLRQHPENIYYFKKDGHFNERGHEVTSQVLADALRPLLPKL